MRFIVAIFFSFTDEAGEVKYSLQQFDVKAGSEDEAAEYIQKNMKEGFIPHLLAVTPIE